MNMDADVEWKLNWMIEYDTNRKLLQTERTANVQQSTEIERLKDQNKKQNRMVVDLLGRVQNKNVIIQRLIQQCLAHETNNTVVNESKEGASNTEITISTENFDVPTDGKLSEIPDSAITMTCVSETVVATENTEVAHNPEFSDEAMDFNPGELVTGATTTACVPEISAKNTTVCVSANTKAMMKRELVVHKCLNCEYVTDKKSSLVDHMAEFCVDAPFKNMACNICGKFFTRRGLRVHFNNFTTGKHKPRGEHSLWSAEDHEIFKVAAMCGFEYP